MATGGTSIVDGDLSQDRSDGDPYYQTVQIQSQSSTASATTDIKETNIVSTQPLPSEDKIRDRVKDEISTADSHPPNNFSLIESPVVTSEPLLHIHMLAPTSSMEPVEGTSIIRVESTSPPNSSQPTTNPDPAAPKVYHLYKMRWYGLFVIVWLSLFNSFLWINFAPIATITGAYYHVGPDAVNGFSTVFLGCFGPGYLLALWSIERIGIKKSLIWGSFVQSLGTWIRVMSIKDDHSANDSGYGVAMFGQVLIAITAPVLQMVPCRYAIEWFPSSRIGVATTLGVIANPFGTAMGEFIPTVVVDENGGMRTLLIGLAVLATIGSIIVIPFPEAYEDLRPIAARVSAGDLTALKTLRPAPNNIYELKVQATIHQLIRESTPEALAAKEALHRLNWCARMRATYPLIEASWQLLKDWNFMMLFLGYTIGVGIANAFVTLIEQMIKPCGYTKDDAGNYGALIILFGMVGSFIASYYLDWKRRQIEMSPIQDPTDPLDHKHRVSRMYRNVQRFFLVASILSVLFTLLCLRPNIGLLLGVAFSVVGFCVMPLLPIMILLASDCAPHVDADASTGMLQVGSNYGGIIFVSIFSALIQHDPSTYSTVLTSNAIAIFIFLLACVITVGLGYNYQMKYDPSLVTSINTHPTSHPLDAEPPPSILVHDLNGTFVDTLNPFRKEVEDEVKLEAREMEIEMGKQTASGRVDDRLNATNQPDGEQPQPIPTNSIEPVTTTTHPVSVHL